MELLISITKKLVLGKFYSWNVFYLKEIFYFKFFLEKSMGRFFVSFASNYLSEQ